MRDLISYISKAVTARKFKFYKHLDFGNDNFASPGCSAPSVNLGPVISPFLFVDYFASNYSYVFHSCIPSPRLLSRSWVKVKCRSELCE